MDKLSKCQDKNMADPSLVMVLDEASNLFYVEYQFESDAVIAAELIVAK